MLRRLVATGFIALVVACASPTLPLPPPEDISVVRVDSTHVALSATCNGAPPDVILSIFNDNFKDPADVGTLALSNACGAWAADSVPASRGDVLTITYEQGSQISQPATVVAP
jgi:hypothetical protein